MKIFIPNRVSRTCIRSFQERGFEVVCHPGVKADEFRTLTADADAIVVRSYDLRQLSFGPALKAIGRAGVGVNHIPVEACTEAGIVVFNTPGANANAVKELVICGLFLSSRPILEGIGWTLTQRDAGAEISRVVEEGKRQFRGEEIQGKTLGVIGLGAIGMLVANDAVALGMNVVGYDPYISVANAWMLSKEVRKAETLESLLRSSDYLTAHVPLNDKTHHMLNRQAFSIVKRGVRILNFTRDEIVCAEDLVRAIRDGIVSRYVTDFPRHDLIGMESVILIPHLGASTAEAEENCAAMIARQISDFLTHGAIRNSVNFPECDLDRDGHTRLTVINRNVPRMIEEITEALAERDLNIEEMINKSRGNIAYTILDISGEVTEEVLRKIRRIEGVIRATVL
jgi:D-3-phosphoglycerate dehydrogenase